jgi:membrane protease YdiL (CAAX protease family)
MILGALLLAWLGWAAQAQWWPNHPATIALHLVLGAAIGAALAAGSQGLARLGPAQSLERDLSQLTRTLLPKLRAQDVALLAALSGFAEELLFRGILQPELGLLASSTLFGAMHWYGRKLWYYPMIASALGFLLGALYTATGYLLAPIAAHATINAINLPHLSTRELRPDEATT